MNVNKLAPPLLRSALLRQLRQYATWDVIVVGGGATGLGAALDAAARGYRTLLLEAQDFAQGTSSRSTKLVHGGVRYLAQGKFALVRQALHERAVIRRNAPHLFHELGFVIPAYGWAERAKYGLGLKVYDALAGKHGLAPSRILSRSQTCAALPTLRTAGLQGGVLYFDGQFDDARLAITLMRSIFDQGGLALNYCSVIRLCKQQGKVDGLVARDIESGEEFVLRARVVINASGVWADSVRRMDQADVAPILAPSQGIHLVFDADVLATDYALLLPKTADGRVLFITPWQGRVLAGTTDTPRLDTPFAPQPIDSEIDDILTNVNRYLQRPLSRREIRGSFAGLRPLVNAGGHAHTPSSAISREHVVLTSASGLITVVGGKWTTYRVMAEQAVDAAARIAGLPVQPCSTAELHLHGYTPGGSTAGSAGVQYGSDQVWVDAMPGAGLALDEVQAEAGLQITQAQVRYAVRYELARSADDILSRRTRLAVLDHAAAERLTPLVETLIAQELRTLADEEAKKG